MARISKSARVGTKTVTKLSRDEIRLSKDRRKKPDTVSLTVVKVHKRVWQMALKLAHGDAKRLHVIDESTVIVVNNPRKYRKTHGNA